MNKQELKKLAVDVIHGEIITSLQLKKDEIDIVFMMLNLFKWQDTRRALKDWGCVYGYVNSAPPMGINGLPVVFKWGFLNSKETKKFIKYWKKLSKKLKKYDSKEANETNE